MPGPRLERLLIKRYRSVNDAVILTLPKDEPLVLIGENNAGKSNILRALGFLLGEFWPGNYQPEDHEFFGGITEGFQIKIGVDVSGVLCAASGCGGQVGRILWQFPPDEDERAFSRSGPCGHTFMSNEIREQIFCMSIGAQRDLAYQLSYSSKWTTLSKLMRRFHDRLVSDPDRVEKLKAVFATVVDTFQEVEEFQSFGTSLKESFDDFGGNLRYGLGIDFSAYDPSNYFRSLRLFPEVEGSARTFEELGTGQEQVLAMAFAYAYATAFGGDGLVLSVEEPESHLHPLAQQWLASKLRELASTGVQVIVTTHSPYFVDLGKPWTTVVIRRAGPEGGTTATQLTANELCQRLVELGVDAERVTEQNVGEYYDSAATYETVSGFFARACVLVEGQTEHLALSILLSRAGLDLTRQGIAIVPVEGISNMAKWARIFRAYGIPVFPLFDTDRGSRKEAETRAHVQELVAALGLASVEWTAADGVEVGDGWACFNPNYETALRACLGSTYEELEGGAAEVVGRSKPLKARYAARGLRDDVVESSTELELLVGAVAALVGPSEVVEPASAIGSVEPSGLARPAQRRPRL